MSTVKRIDSIADCPEADIHYIETHNAYLLDELPVYFDIFDSFKAIIHGYTSGNLDELIEEFRFFSYQVTEYYDPQGNLLQKYPPITLKEINISKLQPSQFYVSKKKLRCCSSWIKGQEQVIVPIYPGSNYICDGHTRLFAALQKGITKCYVYDACGVDDCLLDFVRMAQERGIESVQDMQLLSDEEYTLKWHKFCDDYFGRE